MTRILIIDDDQLVTMSLQMILEADPDFTVSGRGCSGADAVRMYAQQKPDILLMDIRMPDMTGVDAAEQILKQDPQAKILFLTTFSDDEYIVRALQLGVRGYLLKQDYQSIGDSVRAVMRGQSVFGGRIVSKMPTLLSSGAGRREKENPELIYSRAGITDKEFEIIQLVASGLSNREIAGKIFLSEGTVKNYLSGILDKLGLRDRTQLAIHYLRHAGG